MVVPTFIWKQDKLKVSIKSHSGSYTENANTWFFISKRSKKHDQRHQITRTCIPSGVIKGVLQALCMCMWVSGGSPLSLFLSFLSSFSSLPLRHLFRRWRIVQVSHYPNSHAVIRAFPTGSYASSSWWNAWTVGEANAAFIKFQKFLGERRCGSHCELLWM